MPGSGASAATMEASETPSQRQSKPQRGGHRTFPSKQDKKNIKFDPSSLEISSDAEEIRRQVEFYFSDSNLPMDKFLLDQVGGTANRPVKIAIIHNFKRMRHFQPYAAVVAALKDSKVLEVTDDEHVKRKEPLSADLLGKSVEEAKKLVDDKTITRSIYAKGFGEEMPMTQFDIEAFFAPYGPVNAIRLRRSFRNVFKGSVFVEFADEATQQAFLALDPKPKWKGEELLIKGKKQYVDEKAAEIEAGRIRVGEKWKKIDKEHGAKGPDPRNWNKRREEDQKRGMRGDRARGGRDRGRGRGQNRGSGGRGGYGRNGGRREPVDDRDPHTIPKIICTTSDPPTEDESISPHKRYKPSPPQSKTERKPAPSSANEASEKAVNGDKGLAVTTVETEDAAVRTEDAATKTEDAATKTEDAAKDPDAASKKRTREEDGEEGGQAKKVDIKPDPDAARKKRAQEEDGEEGDQAKKVDIKPDPDAASKKRAREEDGEEGGQAKKADIKPDPVAVE